MKELIRQQDQCQIYAQDAAKSLSSFFRQEAPENFFYVSFSNEKGFGAGPLEPNAATSIACGVFSSINPERGKALCGDAWTALRENVKIAANYVVNSDLSTALPLMSMGKLPIHSVAHLIHLCLCYDDEMARTNQPSIFKEVILAICVRRLLAAVEYDLKADNGSSSRERLHPYLLYVSSRALNVVGNKLSSENLDIFETNLTTCESILLNVIKAKYKTKKSISDNNAKADLEFYWGEPGDEIKKKISKENRCQLFSRIKERTVVLAQAQIANYAGSVSPDFDPSSLAFAIATLSELNTSRYKHIVRQGLDLLLKVFEEDEFASTVPFIVDDKGRATFVPSVETANILLKICGEQDSRSAELGRVVNAVLRFERRLEETKQSVTADSKQIKGWCNDKAPSKGRVDSWVTAYALEFFYRNHEIVKLEKRRTIFEDYSWTSYEKCTPEWSDILDPKMTPTNEPIKKKIMSLIDATEKDRCAPVFLLYGPPGTSKTSFVKGVAHHKQWDLISLSPSDFISESVDRIEHRARKIFRDLMNIDECVILFDEMDSLLMDRDGDEVKDSVLKFVVPAFLPKLQDLHDHVAKNQMAVFFVTNYGERIDSAIKRKGRIDEKLLILPYNAEARKKLLQNILVKKFPSVAIDSSDNAEAITTALGKMCPLSVYRDVLDFAFCFNYDFNKLTFNEDQAKLIYSEGISIPAKTYEKNKRDGALDEFLAILAMISNDRATDWSSWDKVRGATQEKFNCDKDFEQWVQVIHDWLKSPK